MKFCIREWSNDTIVLMTESGHVLAYFVSIAEALSVCDEWYRSNRSEKKYEVMVQYKQSGSSYASVALVA